VTGFCITSGFEPTAAALGFTLLRLARDPDLRAQLPDEPAQIPAFVDGVLRHRRPEFWSLPQRCV
jgi:cytochrome P450